MRGRTYASITVVHVRSYSRYSPETRCESEISPSNPSFRRSASAASSCAGFAYAFMKQIATDVDVLGVEDVERGGDVVLYDRRPDLAVRKHALGHRQAQPSGDERRRLVPEEVVGIAAVAASDLEDVAEAACAEQADDGARAGEERVEADGRAVEEVARDGEPLGRYGSGDRGEHALFGRSRCRRLLPDVDLAGFVVVEDQIGERPADVDAEACCHCGLPFL